MLISKKYGILNEPKHIFKGVLMIKRFIEWLISDLSNYNKYSTQQQEEMKYVLTILIYELIKFILILTIFYFFG